jgi:hypothetical protein
MNRTVKTLAIAAASLGLLFTTSMVAGAHSSIDAPAVAQAAAEPAPQPAGVITSKDRSPHGREVCIALTAGGSACWDVTDGWWYARHGVGDPVTDADLAALTNKHQARGAR